jgi:SAM-dependent methyltransferase
MRDYLISIAGTYESADLRMSCVDHRVDLTELPFEDESYDLVYASHVLEHIRNDRKAISEIARIVKRNGIAILPVPVLGEKTIEYDLANPSEDYHVRAPGRDYVDRFKDYFSRVDVFDSSNYDRRYQVYVHEDRSVWPNRYAPNRTPSPGFVHRDYVPVCRK